MKDEGRTLSVTPPPARAKQGTCATCHFWGPPALGSPSGDGECLREDYIDEPPARFRVLAESRYGSSEILRTYLLTKPAFGCVEWRSE